MTATFIILGILWFVSGAWSFIYWWTTKYDFTTNGMDIMTAIMCGFCGPLAYVICKAVVGEGKERVVLKKRKND